MRSWRRSPSSRKCADGRRRHVAHGPDRRPAGAGDQDVRRPGRRTRDLVVGTCVVLVPVRCGARAPPSIPNSSPRSVAPSLASASPAASTSCSDRRSTSPVHRSAGATSSASAKTRCSPPNWRSATSRGCNASASPHVSSTSPANDTEFERMTVSVEVDEETLRELYLVPFEAAVTRAGVRCVMAAYNRLHGTFCSEHEWLLSDVLRGDWGFDGVVMSDWHGCHSGAASLRAGLDVEMPGPPIHRGAALAAEIASGSGVAGRSRPRRRQHRAPRRVDRRRAAGRRCRRVRRDHPGADPPSRSRRDGAAQERRWPAAARAHHPAPRLDRAERRRGQGAGRG